MTNTFKYRKLYKYSLEEDVIFNTLVKGFELEIKSVKGRTLVKLNKIGKIELRCGYSWDGASGPALDTKNFMRATLVHDALYQMLGEGLLPMSERKLVDKTMKMIAREDGMGAFRGWYTYIFVRAFGGLRLNLRRNSS